MYNFLEGDSMYKDVIVALATPMMESALSIIRVSGENSLELLKEIFSNKSNYEGYKVYYGNIVDEDEIIDQVLISTYIAPKSFTGEDSFEINCHGGMFIVKRIISLCLKHGARLADRGEFSKRAFLNGKMDLVQAESINDMIRASSELESKLSVNSLMGNTSKLVENIEKDFLDLLATIEVNIDYPEYDEAEVVTKEYAQERIGKIKDGIEMLIKDSKVTPGSPQDLHHPSSPGSLLGLTPVLSCPGPGGVPATIADDADAFLRPQCVSGVDGWDRMTYRHGERAPCHPR